MAEHASTPEQNQAHTRVLAVIGAGLMGSGIAQTASINGIEVRLFDTQTGAAERAIAGIHTRFEAQIEKGRIQPAQAAAARAKLTAAPSLEAAITGADSVVEAVIESLEIKQQLIADISQLIAPGALIASNTSALPITAIASHANRANEVIGMHFFSPVPATRLCEIVRGFHTSDETVARAQALAAQLGKETIVVARDDAGFVTSRLITVFLQEAVKIVEEGISTPEEIDRACVLAFGHAMGPLATLDLTGIDIGYRAGNGIFEQTGEPRFKPPQLLARMLAAGTLGRKTGSGFFDYQEAK